MFHFHRDLQTFGQFIHPSTSKLSPSTSPAAKKPKIQPVLFLLQKKKCKVAVAGSSPAPCLRCLSRLRSEQWPIHRPHLRMLSCPSRPLMNVSPSQPPPASPWQAAAFPSCYLPPLPFRLPLSSNLSKFFQQGSRRCY